MTQTLILGGGISGAVAAYYMKDALVITDKMGGQVGNKFTLGPKLLHCTPNTARLMDDLHYPLTARTVHVGYCVEGKYVDKLPEKYRAQYYAKTRGRSDPPKSAMSGGQQVFTAWETPLSVVLSILLHSIEKGRVVLDGIKRIDLQLKTVETAGGGTFSFDRLITTLPLPVFYKLTRTQPLREPKYQPTTFLHTADLPNGLNDLHYDYVYFVDPPIVAPYNRATRADEKNWVFEYPGTPPFAERAGTDPNIVVQRIGQILDKEDELTFEDTDTVIGLGRYAEWKHSVLTESVVAKVQKLAGIRVENGKVLQ